MTLVHAWMLAFLRSVMSKHTTLVPSRTPFITLVRFFERCQAEKKAGRAKSDLEQLLNAFQSTEEGRADLFAFYRLLFPKAPDCCSFALLSDCDCSRPAHAISAG